MPTYEFACVDCGNRFEIFQRHDEDPPTVCEVCGGPLRKVFHPVGVVLKGSGFYRTDSRPAPKKDSKPSSGEGKKDAGAGKKDAGPAKEAGTEKKEKSA